MKSPLQKIEYDKTVDALYVRASKGNVYKTYKLSSQVLLDVDKKGKLVGIEVLDASMPLAMPLVKSKRIRRSRVAA